MAKITANTRRSTYSGVSTSTVNQSQKIEAIRKKAYELYEKRGKKPGYAMSDWLEAERLVSQGLI